MLPNHLIQTSNIEYSWKLQAIGSIDDCKNKTKDKLEKLSGIALRREWNLIQKEYTNLVCLGQTIASICLNTKGSTEEVGSNSCEIEALKTSLKNTVLFLTTG